VELARVELSGRPVQTMAEDDRSPMGRHGLLGLDVRGRAIDGVDQTVVQVLLDDDRSGFDPTLLDSPVVAEVRDGDGRVLAQEPFDHDRFRRRLLAERDAGESVARGVLVLTDGELPPPWVRLAFLPIAIEATAGAVLTIRRTTVAELLGALDDAYARGEITEPQYRERLAVLRETRR
jgi:putative membrane protein